MKHAQPSSYAVRSGSALVITLFVLVVLSVIVIAFLSSMTIERSTANSYAELLKAELAAEAGFTDAVGRLKNADPTFPISSYEERPVGYHGGIFTSGTLLTAPYLVMLRPKATWDGVQERKFLAASTSVSGTTRISDASAPPSNDANADTTDINAVLAGFPGGWIGLTGADNNRRIVPTEWIYVRDSAGTVVGRYSFWVDDESARIDMRNTGSLDTSVNPHAIGPRQDGASPSEVSLKEVLSNDESILDFLSFRSNLGPSWRGLNGYLQLPSEVEWKSTINTLATSMGWGAKADERGALGIRKINLNTWAAKNADFISPTARGKLAQKVGALGDFINQADPKFGTRIYSNPTTDDQRIYCIKLAANIQDYIDADHQPTVIRRDPSDPNKWLWQEPPDPTKVGEGAPELPPVAFGKEVVPAICEYVGHYYNENNAGVLRIDHTFEVWNIHAKRMALSTSEYGTVKILMAERNQIDLRSGSTGSPPDLPGLPGNPPLVLNVPADSVIEAGHYALLTTVPAGTTPNDDWQVFNNPIRIRLPRGEPTYSYGTNGLAMQEDGAANDGEAATEIVVVNQYGYLDIQPRVAQQGSGVTFQKTGAAANQKIASQPFGNDGTASGSKNAHRKYPLDSGDPRSLTEIFPSYSEGATISSIAWRRNSTNVTASATVATRLGADSHGDTFGIFPANTGDQNLNVPEPAPLEDMDDPLEAISVIRDGAIRTIGELGFIYDPAVGGAGYVNGTRARGGFRTLSIGSKMGETEGPNNLTQVNETNRAARLLELFTAEKPDTRGGVLLNSALRNPSNLPLRALFASLKTQDNDAPTTIFPSPRDQKLQKDLEVDESAVVTAMETYARTETDPVTHEKGEFLLLGQLSNLPIFNTGATLFKNPPKGLTLTATAKNQEVMDRGREEVFRRVVGLLTLKGSVFRIYVIGQSGLMNSAGKFVPRATRRSMRLCEIERDYPAQDSLADLTMPTLLTNNKPKSAIRIKRLGEISQ